MLVQQADKALGGRVRRREKQLRQTRLYPKISTEQRELGIQRGELRDLPSSSLPVKVGVGGDGQAPNKAIEQDLDASWRSYVRRDEEIEDVAKLAIGPITQFGPIPLPSLYLLEKGPLIETWAAKRGKRDTVVKDLVEEGTG